MDEDRLPGPALVLIAIGTTLMWIVVLLSLLAVAFAGPSAAGAGLADYLGLFIGDDRMAVSVALNIGMSVLSFVAIWACGTIILWFTMVRRHDRARRTTLWLAWAMIALSLAGAMTAAAPVVEFSGSVWSAAPILLSRLPILLVEVALLFCAIIYLRKPPPGVF